MWLFCLLSGKFLSLSPCSYQDHNLESRGTGHRGHQTSTLTSWSTTAPRRGHHYPPLPPTSSTIWPPTSASNLRSPNHLNPPSSHRGYETSGSKLLPPLPQQHSAQSTSPRPQSYTNSQNLQQRLEFVIQGGRKLR